MRPEVQIPLSRWERLFVASLAIGCIVNLVHTVISMVDLASMAH